MEKLKPTVRDTRDPLTGLLDRTAFRALLETERERSARSHRPFGLTMRASASSATTAPVLRSTIG